ncbi:polysaccharide biosynthesis tyrosine autokinase [Curtobacterium sp. VKM Ac-2922]|uniref:polysaccharide biosynthesis tyrosine autokinase n=1 Tax=Curtobacterium sp. VKM Ac-2922 TaxID=2929475 RepID=UPI001FB3A8F6|nr:polysaccharide biosynthesis tyrosine autokinase [Curtobacterium sp. VKM Ac-2922]MCJ1714084.1 polysaccharide biosynthesis tyrosine autokinase [Curtobacterium sp. VKM Ac-2922]
MDFHLLMTLLRRGWLIILVATLAGIGAGAALVATTTPQYRASTSLYVSVKGGNTSTDLVQGGSAAEQKVQTFASVARSALVLQPVIDELGLHTGVVDLARQVEAQSPIDSVLVTIAVTDTSAERSAAIANAVAAQLRHVVTDRLEKPDPQGQSPFAIETIQPAIAPSTPASPRLLVNLVGGGAVGLLAGLAIAALRLTLDVRLRDRDEVERIASAPVIGSIAFDRGVREQPLVVHAHGADPRAEEFRRLRTNLQFLEAGRATKSFLVTSSVANEGKSTTAANLAISLAQNGARVALVDADLRRPRIASLMGLEGQAGLSDVLIGRVELEDALQPWGRDDLVMLPSGQIPPNPAELLGTLGMKAVLHELEEAFDIVIIDAPPMLPVTDAAILGRVVGGTLLVASMAGTSRKHLARAAASLRDSGVEPIGSILTMVRTVRADRQLYTYEQRAGTAADAASETLAGRHSDPAAPVVTR